MPCTTGSGAAGRRSTAVREAGGTHMCGITGLLSFDRDLRGSADALNAMTQTMECRGPDDRGTWIEGPAALGHRRLAIIDLPGGRQPMTVETPDGTVAMVYSGEAYHFT